MTRNRAISSRPGVRGVLQSAAQWLPYSRPRRGGFKGGPTAPPGSLALGHPPTHARTHACL
eukprot:12726242-Alexandrium_andersonii.AAC.1